MNNYTAWEYSNALGYSALFRRKWPHGKMEFLQSPEGPRPWRFLNRAEAEAKALELNCARTSK